jgi:hypothetical protein
MRNSTALLLVGYNRPELLFKRISEIALMNLDHIYISIDGGDESHSKEMIKLKNFAQKLLSKCKTLRITHHEKNLGMTKHIAESISRVLNSHDSIAVVEDDIQLNKYFFKNIRIGLDILLDRKAFGTVSGFSPLNFSGEKFFRNAWRSTPYFYCWGWGCTKESWDNYRIEINDLDLAASLASSNSWNRLNDFQKNYWISKFNKVIKNSEFTWDYQMQYISFKHDYLNLVPKYRFIDNEGFNDIKAVHTKGNKPFLLRNNAKNIRIIEKETNKFSNQLLQKFDSNLFVRDTKISKLFQKHINIVRNVFKKVIN